MHDFAIQINEDGKVEITIYLNGDNPSFIMSFNSIESVQEFADHFEPEIMKAKREFLSSQKLKERMKAINESL